IKLKGTPGANAQAAVWGPGCTVNGSNECEVTVSSNKTIEATFPAVQHKLKVTLAGSGGGTVVSSPAGLNSPPRRREASSHPGTPAKLNELQSTAAADARAGASGPAGTVNGSNECEVTMTADKDTTATFTPEQHKLKVTLAGSGGGTVVSSP